MTTHRSISRQCTIAKVHLAIAKLSITSDQDPLKGGHLNLQETSNGDWIKGVPLYIHVHIHSMCTLHLKGAACLEWTTGHLTDNPSTHPVNWCPVWDPSQVSVQHIQHKWCTRTCTMYGACSILHRGLRFMWVRELSN